MCRHIYSIIIIACDVKQPISVPFIFLYYLFILCILFFLFSFYFIFYKSMYFTILCYFIFIILFSFSIFFCYRFFIRFIMIFLCFRTFSCFVIFLHFPVGTLRDLDENTYYMYIVYPNARDVKGDWNGRFLGWWEVMVHNSTHDLFSIGIVTTPIRPNINFVWVTVCN